MTVKPRSSVRERKAVRIGFFRAFFINHADGVARPAKVFVADAYRGKKSVACRITCANAESSRPALFDFKLQDDRIRLNARQHFRFYVLKKSEIINALNTAPRQLRIKRLTDFLPHFADNNIILSFFIPADLVAFQRAFIDFQVNDSAFVHVHIVNFHENISVGVIFFENRRHIVMQSVAVENFAALDRDIFLKLFSLINRVAGKFNVFQNRIFKHVISYHNAFGNFADSLISVIKIADVFNRVQIAHSQIGIKIVADVSNNRRFNGRQSFFARALKSNIDNSFAVVFFEVFANHCICLSFALFKLRSIPADVQRRQFFFRLIFCGRFNCFHFRRFFPAERFIHSFFRACRIKSD